MFNTPWRCAVLAVVLVGVGSGQALAQPTVVFDYSLDTSGFFGAVGSPQRAALDAAASRLTSRLADSLTAITPGSGNTWTATFNNPTSGAATNVTDLTIAANTIRIYVGGRSLGVGTLGLGQTGGFTASGSVAFGQTVASRGQAGALTSPPTDFGPWGGSIAFDSTTTWNFSLTGPVAGQVDFLSVAEHELGHVLGFGTADSWKNLITGTTFNGPISTALNGGVHPSVSADGAHWAPGTTYMGQPAAMTPSISAGVRQEFTELDFAGLADLGWQIVPVPEPATVLGVAVLGLVGAWGVRRRTASRRPSPAGA
jgi:hypothetical protein